MEAVAKKTKQLENGDEGESRAPVQISRAAHTALLGVRAGKPRPSLYAVLSRLALWYVRQKPYVQTAVIGGVDDGMEHVYADALELLARELRAKANHVGGIATRTAAVREPGAAEANHPKNSEANHG
jgi:hypothetical protein